jgi:hypothetical protein
MRAGFMIKGAESLLFFLKTQVLDIDSLLQRDTLLHGRLLEVLAGTHLADSSGLLELALEFLQGSFDVFAFFDGNDDHAFTPPFSKNWTAKVEKNRLSTKLFAIFVVTEKLP